MPDDTLVLLLPPTNPVKIIFTKEKHEMKSNYDRIEIMKRKLECLQEFQIKVPQYYIKIKALTTRIFK